MTAAAVLASVAMLAVALAAILRVRQYWREQVSQCQRCRHVWSGLDRDCPRCLSRGRLARHGVIPPHRVPDHDWQGWMETGPLRVVSGGGAP